MRFEIPFENIGKLAARAESVRKKCARHGCSFSFSVSGPVFLQRGDHYGKFMIVEAEALAVANGWQFVARLDHREPGNIVRSCCNVEIPEEYRRCGPWCDHCRTRRRRRDSFVIREIATGEFRQVGRDCLREYTGGLSLEAAAACLSFIGEIEKRSGQESGAASLYPLEDVLPYAVLAVGRHGFIPSGKGTPGRPCSAVTAGMLFADKPGSLPEEEIREAMPEARAVANWGRNLAGSSTYYYNIRMLCTDGYAGVRDFGLLCAAVHSYRTASRAKKDGSGQGRHETCLASRHVGTIGESIVVDVESLERLGPYEGDYGPYHVWKIFGKDGNLYVWKTSSRLPEKASVLRGTVKRHSTFKGVQETELARCKAV